MLLRRQLADVVSPDEAVSLDWERLAGGNRISSRLEVKRTCRREIPARCWRGEQTCPDPSSSETLWRDSLGEDEITGHLTCWNIWRGVETVGRVGAGLVISTKQSKWKHKTVISSRENKPSCGEKKNNYGVLQGAAVNSLSAMIIIYVNTDCYSNWNYDAPEQRRCGERIFPWLPQEVSR